MLILLAASLLLLLPLLQQQQASYLSGCHVLIDCAAVSPWYARAFMP
jgi:hypothetical protein